MPIILPKDIPASKTLSDENIFVMSPERASSQDIRPLEIAILNLMPTKIETETQLLRLLSNSPLQINITLLSTETYVGHYTAHEHLEKFYKSFSDIKDKKFDGLIITGAPVEELDYKDVKYWDELTKIFEYAKTNVTSTIFICWGAQAALYYYYGIEKHKLDKKLFGIYKHVKEKQFDPLLKGTDDRIFIPYSCHTTVSADDIKKCEDLEILAYSKIAGAGIIRSKDEKFIFITGHAEYDRDTLEKEYKRDLAKGLKIDPPENYYVEDGSGEIKMCWVSTANLIYMNWLNHYVYQSTPYDIDKIK